MRAPSIEELTAVVAAEWGISVELLRSEQRTKSVIEPRGVIYVLARERTMLTWAETAAYFGRGVRGAIDAYHATEARMQNDKDLRARVRKVRAQLAQTGRKGGGG